MRSVVWSAVIGLRGLHEVASTAAQYFSFRNPTEKHLDDMYHKMPSHVASLVLIFFTSLVTVRELLYSYAEKPSVSIKLRATKSSARVCLVRGG